MRNRGVSSPMPFLLIPHSLLRGGFIKIVPHFDAQELRHYLHQVMATFRTTGKEVVMVVDRSGIHRAHKLDTTLERYHSTLRFHFLPAHCGHHLNPIEGFWRSPFNMCPDQATLSSR